MALNADPIKEFFLKRILLPKVFRIDVPGYVIGKYYTLQGQNAFVRNIFLSEPFFISLEEKVSEAYGRNGMEKLYGAGKRFGYRFSELTRMPKSDLEFSVKMSFKFFESLYAESITVDVDINHNVLTLDTSDLVVTRVNGGGLPLTVGGCAGIWGYFLNNFDGVECGVVPKGPGKYALICGPEVALQERGVQYYESKGKPETINEKYVRFNKPPNPIPAGAFNVNKLMQTGLFMYEKGSLKFSLPNVRLIPVEISLPYDLERLFGDQIMYEVAKESFMIMGKNLPKQTNSYSFLANMLTALGYGIVTTEKTATHENFNFMGVPWYAGAEESRFPVLRGAIEGFLEGQMGTKISAIDIKSELYSNSLSVSIGIAT